MAVTKDTIIDELVNRYAIKRREAIDLVDTFFDDIKNALSSSDKVRLPGFGLFFKSRQPYTPKKRKIESETDNEWYFINFKESPTLKKKIQRALIEEAKDVD